MIRNVTAALTQTNQTQYLLFEFSIESLSARRREPQAGAGQANGSALLRFGWTICDKSPLCQPDLADVNFLPGRN